MSDKISVVTVVYNGGAFLEDTILSVINQSYDNIEYIIVDGGSTDDTLDIIKKYASKISLWISEPDKGIYDAMNKGINLASGKWINFMNAGDQFYSSDTVNKIFSVEYDNIDIIYGNTIMYLSLRFFEVVPFNIAHIEKSMPFCHQSIFAKKDILVEYGLFNIKYRICADYDLFYKLYLGEKQFKYIPISISVYEAETGLSSKKILHRLKENFDINKNTILYLKEIIKYLKSIMIQKTLPKSIYRKVNQMRVSKRSTYTQISYPDNNHISKK